MKNCKNLHRTLLTLLDLRSLQETENLQQAYSGGSLEAAEQEVNNLAISITMKMNDKLFRPFFIELVDWTSASTAKSRKVKECRIISFFKFYETFNDRLKVREQSFQHVISLMSNHFKDNCHKLRNLRDRFSTECFRHILA